MIPVTKPFLPPLENYQKYLDSIWKSHWLTNNGPLAKKLVTDLGLHLGVGKFVFVNNGTIALQLAIKALELKGEIITTPFSFVATTDAIVWEGCTPVFVDVDAKTLNIDPLLIERAITPRTSAILATHCYGNPCDIAAISAIARKHNVKVIYDAAHCFGTLYEGKSVFAYGDVSTASFHATKLFHTGEGGAVFAQDPQVLEKIRRMHNFGQDEKNTALEVGINGKSSELHAAMGLANLEFMGEIMSKRRSQSEAYDSLLSGSSLMRPQLEKKSVFNFAYYPVIFPTEKSLLHALSALNAEDIWPRRYFWPSLNTLPFVKGQAMPVAEDLASRVLCLPLYHDLSVEDLRRVSSTLLRSLEAMT